MSAAELRRLQALNADLQHRLEVAEETLHAIHAGAVDAFVMSDADRVRVFTLETADRPYRLMVENMQQGALLVSADGVVLFGNEHFARLVRVPAESLVGGMLTSFVAPADRLAVQDLLTAADADAFAVEVTVVTSSGEAVPVRVAANEIPGGPAPARCVIVTDLTERKAHEALERAQVALRDSESRLREADRRKDEFLATLAHELRNPLVPLRNGLKVMQLAGSNPGAMEQARAMMKRQLLHMVRLIDDLLDVSRITLGKIELRTEPISLEAAVRAAVEAAQPLLDGMRHKVTISASEPLVVDGDMVRLAQVFTNLLTNASKYSPRGAQIEVTLARAGHDAIVSVRDTGHGIAPESLPHVFEPFTRTGEHEVDGLGVGLTICRQLVAMHQGNIEARSGGAGQGSEFVVRLPLAESPLEHPALREATAPVAADQRPGPRRILVAEDSADSAASMALMLRVAGHDVRVASEGLEAFELADWFRPHVMLVDLRMPKLDGAELCRRVRDRPWGAAMSIIAVTGWVPPGAEALREAGFDQLLLKPVDPDALMELIGAAGRRLETREAGAAG